MRIGRLDQRVTLLELVEGVDEFGAPIEEWVEQGTVSADVIAQRGDESFEAARTEATRLIKVLMRFRDDVTTTWRLQWRGEAYDIVDVDRAERRKGELWLMGRLRGAE